MLQFFVQIQDLVQVLQAVRNGNRVVVILGERVADGLRAEKVVECLCEELEAQFEL